MVALVKTGGEKLLHIFKAVKTLASNGDQVSLEEPEGETMTPRILSEQFKVIHFGDLSEGGGGGDNLREPPGRREHFSQLGNSPEAWAKTVKQF